MRLIIIIMTTFLIQASANSFGQKVTLSEKNGSLVNIFEQIRTQTGYDFMYSKSMMQNAKPVTIEVKEAELDQVLKQIFNEQPLNYSVKNKAVIVQLRPKSFLDKLVDGFNSIDANGRVVDDQGKGLPGASVKVKSTGKAVSTDANGKFFLRGVEEGVVLIVSFIGYLPKEVNASANMGNVVLEQSLSKLDEVQVIAYGTTTQRLSTGNVTTIKADVIEKQPVNNPLLALQGRVPGLFIEQATGFAGTGVKVRIQGNNSVYFVENDPLISGQSGR